jgi:pimeloyl-ACP methyl ester carboxylesterase
MSEEEYLARGHAATVEKAESDGHRIWSASLRLSSPLAVYRGAVSLVRGSSPSWREMLLSLPMPCTVIFGANSLPDPDAERLPKAGIAVLTVPEAGHSMAWENPSGYAEAIGAALA